MKYFKTEIEWSKHEQKNANNGDRFLDGVYLVITFCCDATILIQ